MNQQLLNVLKHPGVFQALHPGDMDLILRQAGQARLLGVLARKMTAGSYDGDLQERVRERLLGARLLHKVYERALRWETEQLRMTLAGVGLNPVLLKGAAYIAGDLKIAQGRVSADVDILLPEQHLTEAERALRAAGWLGGRLSEYDDRYYREWSHELPPLRHRVRGVECDIHHNIMPRTARLKPDARKLIQAALPVGRGDLRVLCAEDMVLHNVVHHFWQGEFDNSLRELVDLDGMLREFAAQPGFWERLVPRGREMDLGRPLYYGLRYARRLLDTPVPDTVMKDASLQGPNALVRMLMDVLVTRALVPELPMHTSPWRAVACWLLYVRGHWIKMPPLLLLKHLSTKALMRLKRRAKATA